MKHHRRRNQWKRLRLSRHVEKVSISDAYECQDLLDFIRGMGYIIYEHPCDEGFALISAKVLTFGWLKKHAKAYGVRLSWWKKYTDWDTRLKEELDELT